MGSFEKGGTTNGNITVKVDESQPRCKGRFKKRAEESPSALRGIYIPMDARSAFLFFVPVGVDLNELFPLVRSRRLLKDRLHGTNRLASPAVDALLGVNVELLLFLELLCLVLCGMNAIHGTDIHARGILHVDAGFGNNVGHLTPPQDNI